MLPLLHLRRGRQQPPRKHHRLGAGRLPRPLLATTPSPNGTSSTTSTACSTILPTATATKANLKRELPHIPFAPDFRAFAEAGARLATIHVGYEEQPEYRLRQVETPDMPLDWRVEKMRLSKDKTQLRYNDFLTLDGIPAAAFGYRLGNRSALEWVIDQYRVKTDKRSEIVNDPNQGG